MYQFLAVSKIIRAVATKGLSYSCVEPCVKFVRGCVVPLNRIAGRATAATRPLHFMPWAAPFCVHSNGCEKFDELEGIERLLMWP
jgi:hypothetical protein